MRPPLTVEAKVAEELRNWLASHLEQLNASNANQYAHHLVTILLNEDVDLEDEPLFSNDDFLRDHHRKKGQKNKKEKRRSIIQFLKSEVCCEEPNETLVEEIVDQLMTKTDDTKKQLACGNSSRQIFSMLSLNSSISNDVKKESQKQKSCTTKSKENQELRYTEAFPSLSGEKENQSTVTTDSRINANWGWNKENSSTRRSKVKNYHRNKKTRQLYSSKFYSNNRLHPNHDLSKRYSKNKASNSSTRPVKLKSPNQNPVFPVLEVPYFYLSTFVSGNLSHSKHSFSFLPGVKNVSKHLYFVLSSDCSTLWANLPFCPMNTPESNNPLKYSEDKSSAGFEVDKEMCPPIQDSVCSANFCLAPETRTNRSDLKSPDVETVLFNNAFRVTESVLSIPDKESLDSSIPSLSPVQCKIQDTWLKSAFHAVSSSSFYWPTTDLLNPSQDFREGKKFKVLTYDCTYIDTARYFQVIPSLQIYSQDKTPISPALPLLNGVDYPLCITKESPLSCKDVIHESCQEVNYCDDDDDTDEYDCEIVDILGQIHNHQSAFSVYGAVGQERLSNLKSVHGSNDRLTFPIQPEFVAPHNKNSLFFPSSLESSLTSENGQLLQNAYVNSIFAKKRNSCCLRENNFDLSSTDIESASFSMQHSNSFSMNLVSGRTCAHYLENRCCLGPSCPLSHPYLKS